MADCAPGAEPTRGGLAPWQVKRACEKLESDLGGKHLAATDRGRVRSLGQPFFARISHLHRPAAAPMAASPAREDGQAVDDRARPAAVGDCDIGRVCQSKPLHAGVFGRRSASARRRGAAKRRAHRKAKPDLFVLTRFLPQISLRNLRKLDCYANRYSLRLKTLCRISDVLPARSRRRRSAPQTSRPADDRCLRQGWPD